MAVAVRQNAWYGDTLVELDIPAEWELMLAPQRGAPALSEADIEKAILNPIGQEPLNKLAKGKQKVVILIEDMTRPIACEPIFNVLLKELNAAGVDDSSILVIVGNGTHRPMTRPELVLKIGEENYKRLCVLPHNCYDNLTFVGKTRLGTELYINTDVATADLVIGVGGLYPHVMAGFSGGGKIILPGVSGIQSIEHNHNLEGSPGYGVVEPNPLREDMEEGARLAKLSFIVNAVVNGERKICGLFAGDLVQAHREAAAFSDKVYYTEIHEKPDVAILNAYPMDYELFPAGKALSVSKYLKGVKMQVLLAVCEMGFGYHALCGPGGRDHSTEKARVKAGLGGSRLVICSPNVNNADVRKRYPDDTILCKNWKEVVDVVNSAFPDKKCKVALFPEASLQLPAVIKSDA